MSILKNQWLLPSSIAEAKNSQYEMAQQVVIEDKVKQPISFVGGMDVSNNLYDPAQMIYASAVVLSYPSFEIQESVYSAEKQEFAYVPGLLGFREAPALVNAFKQLSIRPDVIMVDGHGISHPRGLGIASHLGVLLDIPTIGVAKSILVGVPKSILSDEVGSMVPLIWKDKEIAMLVRTKKRCSPLIISAGHKITLQTALNVVQSCLKGYKLPEPTRQAHLAANACCISYKNSANSDSLNLTL